MKLQQILILTEKLKLNYYKFHLIYLMVKNAKGITYVNSKNSIAIVFADDSFLTRSMNSILGLAHVLLNYENIGIDRIGTQVLEIFFGQVRYSCDNYDSWERILSTVSRGILSGRI